MAEVPVDTPAYLEKPLLGIAERKGKRGCKPSHIQVLSGEAMRADSLRERLTGRHIPVRTRERGELCERFAACRVWRVHEGEAVEDWLVMREESQGTYSYALYNAPADTPLQQLAWLYRRPAYDVCGSANATSLSAPTRTANPNWVGTRCGRRSTALGNIISPSPSWLPGSWRRPHSSGPRTSRVTRRC
jgi:hypothetical protein